MPESETYTDDACSLNDAKDRVWKCEFSIDLHNYQPCVPLRPIITMHIAFCQQIF